MYMKRIIYFSLIALLAACSKENSPAQYSEVIVTSTADVAYRSVTVSGYLNVDGSVLNTCQFGILYSTNQNPSKDNGLFANSVELDSKNKFKVTLYFLAANTEYFYKAFVKYESGSYQYGDVMSFRTNGEKIISGAVDLGLPVKWAACNLGASKPEENGDYYQWAGLEDVTSTSIKLDFSICPYHPGSSYNTGWTKYVPLDRSSYWSGSGRPDGKTALDLDDDVAHDKLGGKWRMPTDEEWKVLMETCIWTWISNYEGTGVAGVNVTSRAYPDKYIFLPAAGDRSNDRLEGVGGSGSYWSSSLYTDSPYNAYSVHFLSNEVSRGKNARYYGLSVRPVYEE